MVGKRAFLKEDKTKHMERLMEKYRYCPSCEEFPDCVTEGASGTIYRRWDGEFYEAHDSETGDGNGIYYCEECGDELQILSQEEAKKRVKPTNEWRGHEITQRAEGTN